MMKTFDLLSALRGSALTPTERHVLINVSFRAGDGVCWASVATLMDDTGIRSDTTVRATLKRLVVLGALERVVVDGLRTNAYRLTGRIPRDAAALVRQPTDDPVTTTDHPPTITAVTTTAVMATGVIGNGYRAGPQPLPGRSVMVTDKKDHEEDHEEERETDQRPAAPSEPVQRVAEPLPLALEATTPPQEPEPDPILGELARKLRVPARVVPLIVRAVSAIRGRDVKLQRCATDAEHVVKLQRAAFTPWEQLVEDIELVARWAHESDDPMAARNLRAEGWEEGRDRSRDVSTLLTQKAWGDRLEAATQWAEQQRPRPVVEQPPEPPEESMLDEWERLGRPRIRGHDRRDDDEDSISAAIRQLRGARSDRRQPTA